MSENIAETVKKSWKSVLAGFSIVPVLITVIYFAADVRNYIATAEDLQAVKIEIINELRDESAKIRVAYLNDLQARLEDVEILMEELDDNDQAVPSTLRRKAKRLIRRIEEISG